MKSEVERLTTANAALVAEIANAKRVNGIEGDLCEGILEIRTQLADLSTGLGEMTAERDDAYTALRTCVKALNKAVERNKSLEAQRDQWDALAAQVEQMRKAVAAMRASCSEENRYMTTCYTHEDEGKVVDVALALTPDSTVERLEALERVADAAEELIERGDNTRPRSVRWQIFLDNLAALRELEAKRNA